MNISYRKILNKNHLILSNFNIDAFNSNYLVNILINNSIDGLLYTELNIIDSMPNLYYDITSKHSLSAFLENKKIGSNLLCSILTHLHRLLETLDKYMLDSCYILLSPDLIYLNPESKIPCFCYCPITENSIEYSLTNNLKILMEYIIANLDYNDKDAVASAYTLHQKCINGTFSINDLLFSIDNNTPESETSSNAFLCESEYTADLPESNPTYYTPESGNNFSFFAFLGFIGIIFISLLFILSAIYFYFMKKSISLNLFTVLFLIGIVIFLLSLPYFNNKRKFIKYMENNKKISDEKSFKNNDNNNIIMPIGDTVLINHASGTSVPHLIYTGNDFNQDIALTGFPFTIGKIKENSDCIIENSLISRIHARFYFKDSCYYIEDMNSSNGTYINSIPTVPHTLTEINDGDFITFAHLTYIFKLS